jgi:hypothetical protein
MGITASYYLMTRAAFDRCRDEPDGDHFPSRARAFDIDKAHDLFHHFFRDLPEPLNHAVEGELCPRSDLDAPSDDATHVGYVSPEAVQQIARALEGIPFEDVLAKARQLGWSEVANENARRYYEVNWLSLRDAYCTAARQGDALAVLMC